MITLQQLNVLPAQDFIAALASIFEHSAWVPERVAASRPFTSGVSLHRAMCDAVIHADENLHLALIRAHPELAGRAAIRGDLTTASTSEQKGAGLAACTPLQYERLQALNAAYNSRFSFPFVLAVKGHTPQSVIATLEQRVTHGVDEERNVALREICRIAHFRLADLVDEPLGEAIVAMAGDLARPGETPGAPTYSPIAPAHFAAAARIRDFLLAAGFAVHGDAAGNMAGVLTGHGRTSKHLLTGSHYGTAGNAGTYDGRLGIVLAIAVAGSLRRAGVQLPCPLEIMAFAEDADMGFESTFLGSRTVAGRFDLKVLDRAAQTPSADSPDVSAAGAEAAAQVFRDFLLRFKVPA